MIRLGLIYLAALLIPFVAAGLLYPALGGAGASAVSVALSWAFLAWGARGVKAGKPRKADYLRGALAGVLVRLLVIASALLLPSSAGESVEGWALVVLAVSALGAPWFEERFFRGALYDSLTPSMGRAGSAILSSAMFALLHYPLGATIFPVMQMVSLFLIGLLFCWLKDRYNSYHVVFSAHLVFNATGLLILLHA